MTFHIKKLGVKLGIRIMEGLIALKKGLAFFLFILAKPIRFLGRTFWMLGVRWFVLKALQLTKAVRQQQSIAAHPLVVIFIALLGIVIVFQFIGPRDVASRETPSIATDVIEQGTSISSFTAQEFSLQTIEAPITTPGEDTPLPLSTIAGGNALVAPSINTTRLENRLREAPEEYIVKEGDTLSDIAEQFGISVETILWENKLSMRSVLRLGMSLTILPVSGISHVVARGETMGSIAKRYKVEERTILDFNEIADTTTIRVGQKLIIPEGEQPAVAPRPVQRPPIAQRPLPTPTPTPGSQLLVPVVYRRISQWFTYRHSGIDMAGTYGTPVVAADDGVVVQSGWGTGYGLYVLIDHGSGLMTRYAHNSKNLVTRGEKVVRGQKISLLGSTGRSTGPHVHFETIVNGRFVNPLRYIKL